MREEERKGKEWGKGEELNKFLGKNEKGKKGVGEDCVQVKMRIFTFGCKTVIA